MICAVYKYTFIHIARAAGAAGRERIFHKSHNWGKVVTEKPVDYISFGLHPDKVQLLRSIHSLQRNAEFEKF